MASTCLSNCTDVDSRVPVRATYVNLYKWPESDAEFVRSVSSNSRRDQQSGPACHPRAGPRVVDSISCRQLYLRSYTFSRKESMPERTKKCFGRVKERVVVRRRKRKLPDSGGSGRRKKCVIITKAKEVYCAAVASIFRRLLSCTTKVDVVG